MGQVLKKLAPGSEEKKIKEIGPLISQYYDSRFKDADRSQMPLGEFYHGVCWIVEQINRDLGNTQFKLPAVDKLREAYTKHHQGKDKELTKEEFQKILKEVITDSGFTGIGAKEAIFYILGVPVATHLLKKAVMPHAIRDEVFVPGVTSATVLVLAVLNKI